MSDAHLGAAPSERERDIAAFLAFARHCAGSVVINGDLFDFWYEWRTVMPRGHIRVLGALAALADAGKPVLMIAGNHDAWGGDVLTREIGAQLVQGPHGRFMVVKELHAARREGDPVDLRLALRLDADTFQQALGEGALGGLDAGGGARGEEAV